MQCFGDIIDEFIFGLEIIIEFGFNKTLPIDNEDILLSFHNLADKINFIMTDDTRIPPNSETSLTAENVGACELGA